MKILLTGASRGLGRALAHELAQRGDQLTLVARSEQALAEVVGELPGEGHRAWPADLAQSAAVHALVERMRGEPFDVLINNAGAARFGALAELSAETAEQVAYLNFTAPVLLSQAFLKQCGPGAMLVNVTSVVGVLPMSGNAVYSGAKAGLSAVTECLYFESRAKGVKVLDYRPVTIKTEFQRAAGGASTAGEDSGVTAQEAARDLAQAIARGREYVYAPGLPSRIVELASRLLPRKLLVGKMHARSVRAGYFGEGE